MGCDCHHQTYWQKTSVSIHAPVWGATPSPRNSKPSDCFNPRTRVGCDWSLYALAQYCDVSIHAPVWGATLPNSQSSSIKMFQSTHPCGVRLADFQVLSYRAKNVSIHAPVWGATCHWCVTGRYRGVSIHAPVWGATRLNNRYLRYAGFQSTHPCGVRQIRFRALSARSSFNPRTRVGCDAIIAKF